MAVESKQSLFERGVALAVRFCEANGLTMPQVINECDRWPFKVCAYYRPSRIHIRIPACAGIGSGGPAWSYPGYVIDRTPYGVIQHELGHHVDWHRGDAVRFTYSSDYSVGVRQGCFEPPITNYCPDTGEWFAEIFRLFVTNPDLLRLIRPRTYARLLADGFKPVIADDWRSVIADAPERTIAACAAKIKAVRPVQSALSLETTL